MDCSEYIKNHSHLKNYLKILIQRELIHPNQADYIIKNIIIDESGKKYNTDDYPDDCGIDIWCDLRAIKGYFNDKNLGEF